MRNFYPIPATSRRNPRAYVKQSAQSDPDNGSATPWSRTDFLPGLKGIGRRSARSACLCTELVSFNSGMSRLRSINGAVEFLNTSTLSSKCRSTDAGCTSSGLNGSIPMPPDAISSRMLLSLNTMSLTEARPTALAVERAISDSINARATLGFTRSPCSSRPRLCPRNPVARSRTWRLC